MPIPFNSSFIFRCTECGWCHKPKSDVIVLPSKCAKCGSSKLKLKHNNGLVEQLKRKLGL